MKTKLKIKKIYVSNINKWVYNTYISIIKKRIDNATWYCNGLIRYKALFVSVVEYER
jgi:hypothetical protein